MEEMNEEMDLQGDGRDYTGPENLPDPSTYLETVDAGVEASKRVERLYGLMGAVRGQLDAILAFCAEPRRLDEIAEEVERARKGAFSMYDAASMCAQLVKAGALEEIPAPAPEPRVVTINGVEYLEPAAEEAGEPSYATTAAGKARLEEASSLGAFEAVLEEDAVYEDIYRILLDLCSNEDGATAKQMGDAVDNEPVMQQPRMYASYFFDRLATCGLVEWSDAWHITDLGRCAIEFLNGRN